MARETQASDIDQLGTVLDGRFKLGEVLGSGPLHRAYRATDLGDGSTVCVKIPLPKFRHNDGFATRYRRDLLDVMQHRDRSWIVPQILAEHKGIPFQVLPLVKGKPLPQWYTSTGRNEQRLLLVLIRAVKGLGRLHRMSDRIHGTIKPNNLFVTDQDEPLFLDLAGTGRLEDHFSEKAESGRPIYCSPEQLSGERADACSDLYSLAMVIYQALTGRHPYFGATDRRKNSSPERLLTSLLSQLQTPPPPPSEVAPDVPLWADRFLARCLRPNPQSRLADHHEALNWLQNHTTQEQDVSVEHRMLPPAGREHEMKVLQQHLDRLKEASEGGLLVRLHGPLGIGKTRCQDWLVDKAQSRGMKVLTVEPTPESGLHLQSVISEMSRTFPDLDAEVPVVENLLTFATEEPILMIIRDVQQADETLVEFLRELESVLPDVALMLLLVDDETEFQSSEMKEFVGGVEHVLGLKPLDKRAIANLIEEKCWTAPAAAVSSWVHNVSGGNALHATLLVGYLRENDFLREGVELEWATTPPTERPTLEETMIWKLGGLSVLGRTILETAAVLGNPFALDTLHAITYRSTEELDDALGEGVGKGLLELLVAVDGLFYRWKHSKFRQAIVKGMPKRRRQRIHRLTAAFYSLGEGQPAKVAYHFFEAGDTREVFYWGALAATAAYGLGRRGECSFWLHRLLTKVPADEWLGPDIEKAKEKVSRDQTEAADLELWCRWFRSLSDRQPTPDETADPVLEAQRLLRSGLEWEAWSDRVRSVAEKLATKESTDEPSSRAIIHLEVEWKTRAPGGELFPTFGD